MAHKSPIGRITYRDHPEDGRYPVKGAWRRLKRWSAAHLPRADEADPPPATEAQLRAFEAAVGPRLPAAVRDSYRVYDGQCAGPGIVYGLAVQPLADCLRQWQTWVKGYGSNLKDGSAAGLDARCTCFPADFVKPVYFDRGWVPLTYDSGGNHIGVDLNPGPAGTPGQVIVFGRDDEFHTVLALSWGQFLTDLADELEAGNYRLGLADQDYPEFNPDDPHTQHFHSIGIHWSRGKLGRRRLAGPDAKAWRKWRGR